jgi:hypothetical protein
MVDKFRTNATTCDPIMNANLVLGMKIIRNRESKTIEVRMESKLTEVVKRFEVELGNKLRKVPMPMSGYLVREYELEELSLKKKQFLDESGINLYLQIVGVEALTIGLRVS